MRGDRFPTAAAPMLFAIATTAQAPGAQSRRRWPALSGGTREKDDEIENHNGQKREEQSGCGEENAFHGIVDEISPQMKPMPKIPKHGKTSFAVRAVWISNSILQHIEVNRTCNS